MITTERALELNTQGLLAEVVGFETTEVVDRAHGADVSTCSGREFIDFTGGIAVHACGHNHAEIVSAIIKQAQRVLHVSDIMRHPAQLELAAFMRKLFAQFEYGEDWSFLFMNSGSESIDSAAKLALRATGRRKFLSFEGAFHGRTLFATALSRSKTQHWAGYEAFLAPLRENIIHLPAPRSQDCVSELRRVLAEQGSEIAALFFEAEQGEGGYFPMPPTFAAEIRELTRQHGILLVADEIQSGWGRTGKWFAFQHLDIVPDMVAFGKAVGGGLPLAGVAARAELMAKWQPGEHGTTFGGNPVSCAAGLAALQIIERESLVERAAESGHRIKTRLHALMGRFGVSDVRGHGLMIGLELSDANGLPDYARCEAVKAYTRDRGLLLLSCGAKIGDAETDSSAIRLIPALNTDDETIDTALNILEEALAATPV